jgi:hypothetical protein
MKSRQLWIGFLVLAVSGSIAEAARTPRTKKAAQPGVTTGSGPSARQSTPTGVRRSRPAVAAKRAPAANARVTKSTPRPVVKQAARPTPAARPQPARWAQATPPEAPAVPSDTPVTPPAEGQPPAMAPVTIPQEAGPLMTRALAAYYVIGDEVVLDLRARGWEYGDIATAANIAVRSRRPFVAVARSFEERRDWTTVAQEMNLAPEQIYIAANSPRYVMMRPTPQEMERMQAARLDEAYQRTLEQYRQSLAQARPPTPDGRLGEASPATPGASRATAAPGTLGVTAESSPAAGQPTTPAAPGAPQAGQPDTVQPDPTRIATDYRSATLTPAERVASARLELAPANSSPLLRRAVANYYVLHPATIRELEAQGWSLADVLVAGNLAHRSDASFDEVVALRQGGEEWRGIAERIGVASEDLYTPTMARRVEVGDWLMLRAQPEARDRPIDRDRRETLPAGAAGQQPMAPDRRY